MVVSVAQAQLFFLALVRILAMIIQVPVLGGQVIPNQIKIGLGILLAMVILPWQPLPPDAQAMSLFEWGMGIGREMLIGTLAGFAAELTFGAIQVASNFMGLNTGFASGQILNPAFGSRGAAYDNLFLIICTLYFLVIDGHLLFIKAIQMTFEIIPLNDPLPSLPFETLVEMTSRLITIGVRLALPIIGALVLTDLTLGLLARIAPQVQVFFLGIPLKIGISLIGLALALGIMLPIVRDLYNALGTRALALLAGGP